MPSKARRLAKFNTRYAASRRERGGGRSIDGPPCVRTCVCMCVCNCISNSWTACCTSPDLPRFDGAISVICDGTPACNSASRPREIKKLPVLLSLASPGPAYIPHSHPPSRKGRTGCMATLDDAPLPNQRISTPNASSRCSGARGGLGSVEVIRHTRFTRYTYSSLPS